MKLAGPSRARARPGQAAVWTSVPATLPQFFLIIALFFSASNSTRRRPPAGLRRDGSHQAPRREDGGPPAQEEAAVRALPSPEGGADRRRGHLGNPGTGGRAEGALRWLFILGLLWVAGTCL